MERYHSLSNAIAIAVCLHRLIETNYLRRPYKRGTHQAETKFAQTS